MAKHQAAECLGRDLRRRLAAATAILVVATLGTVALGGVLPAAGQSVNGAALGIGPTFPITATVGSKNVLAFVKLINVSDPQDGRIIIPANAITLTPACGVLPTGATPPCPASAADPGVFGLSSVANGAPGTQCAGQVYTISPADPATGEVRFLGAAITLTATDPTSGVGGACVLLFTVDVLRVPAHDADPAAAGIQTYQLADAGGWHTDLNNSASCCGSSHTTVFPVSVGINTQMSPPVTLGKPISDTATLTGGITPTGTVQFAIYSPRDTTCAGPPVFTSSVPVTGTGTYNSGPFTPTTTGTYRSVATYSGDTRNASATAPCNAQGESVAVGSPLALSTTKAPILPVTGPDVPVVPLGMLAAVLVAGGALALWYESRRGRHSIRGD